MTKAEYVARFKSFMTRNRYAALEYGNECPDCEILMTGETPEGKTRCTECGHIHEEADDSPFISSNPCNVCGDTLQGYREIFYAYMHDDSKPQRVRLCEDCAYYANYGDVPGDMS